MIEAVSQESRDIVQESDNELGELHTSDPIDPALQASISEISGTIRQTSAKKNIRKSWSTLQGQQ